MTAIMTGALVAMTVIMAIGWLYQRAAGNGGWTDVFWTYGAGLTCAIAAVIPISTHDVRWRQYFVATLLLIWSLRLGTYVALRVARSAEDARYSQMRDEWKDSFQTKMFALLIVQAPITAILNIGVQLAAHRPGEDFRIWDGLGFLVLMTSIFGEMLADHQMKQFKRQAKTGAICERGLWAWSRHPNYFFEFLGWCAYPIIAIEHAWPWSLFSLLSPIMMFLVVRYGTGVPPLETAMVRSKGEAYRRYQERVRIFWPVPLAK